MSEILPENLAAATAITARNEAINVVTGNLPRKIVIIGVADATKLAGDLAVDTLRFVSSPEEVGDVCGEGTMIHRLAIATFARSSGAETWIIPQAEAGSGVQSIGTITVTAGTTLSGTISLYVNGILVKVGVVGGDDATVIGDAIAAAINANLDLPVTAAAALGVVTVTAKSKGSFGNDISLSAYLNNESPVGGVTLAFVDMTGGSGVGDVTLALTEMGVGENSNSKGFTALVHGYYDDQTSLDAISVYNGEGGSPIGNYDPLNGRIFRSLSGSVVNDLGGEIAISDTRKLDRTNGVGVLPNSANHPMEIAAISMGIMEAKNALDPSSGYFGEVLPGVIPGDPRWTDEYPQRDLAVRSGISPIVVEDGAAILKNVVTFYRPNSVNPSNNGYRSMRNISITQNILAAHRAYFNSEDWQNILIVEDVSEIADPTVKRRAKDPAAVRDALLFLAQQFLSRGLLYRLDETEDGLKDPLSVVVRPGGTGFDYTIKYVYSGEGGILNNTVIFDINFGA